ncbi:hypothetical protein [Pseudomonas fluorescens]|uniref:hypothetical protein n=1 Tax=Pseudomonas fluorescens TaxID=294 RepID=UPI003D069180
MSTVNLIKPNPQAAKDCRNYISYYANIKLSHIENTTLKSDLQAVAKFQAELDQKINDVALSSIDLLKPDEVQTALADYDVSEEYKSDLKTIITQRKKDIIELRNTLYSKTFNLETMSYTSNQYRLDELRLTLVNLQDISKKEQDGTHYNTLLMQKYELDVAIDAVHKLSTLDKIKPIFDQALNTAKVILDRPADFKQKLIGQGVNLAGAIYKIAQEQVKYENMIDARNRIIKIIDARELRADDIDRQIKTCINEINNIKEYESIPAIKTQYLNEVKKVLTSFDLFIAAAFPSTEPKENSNSFIKHAPNFLAYTDTLFREWLRS